MNSVASLVNDRGLVIVGGGFAGVWAALAAARLTLKQPASRRPAITVVSRSQYLGLRPRFYEANIEDTQIDLVRLFTPVGVRHMNARVSSIDLDRHQVLFEDDGLEYGALVLAAGSETSKPSLPGGELLQTVDSFTEAQRLAAHLDSLGQAPLSTRWRAVVIGGGFTGLEVATELVGRLRQLARRAGDDPSTVNVTIVERLEHVAPEFGPNARSVIEAALSELGIITHVGVTVAAVNSSGISLADRSFLDAATVVWTGGVRASLLNRTLPVKLDDYGRLPVNEMLAVAGVEQVWAAGDQACALVDGHHVAMMSCQHAMPQGRYAGHNAMNALLGHRPKPYQQRFYLGCLDLGEWGGLMTLGHDRNRIIATGHKAKEFKRYINTSLIYPPLGSPKALMKAARLTPGGRFVSWINGRGASNSAARRMLISRGRDGPDMLRESADPAGAVPIASNMRR
jgi:NADH:ubiquinone reductase (H+-translocating)